MPSEARGNLHGLPPPAYDPPSPPKLLKQHVRHQEPAVGQDEQDELQGQRHHRGWQEEQAHRAEHGGDDEVDHQERQVDREADEQRGRQFAEQEGRGDDPERELLADGRLGRGGRLGQMGIQGREVVLVVRPADLLDHERLDRSGPRLPRPRRRRAGPRRRAGRPANRRARRPATSRSPSGTVRGPSAPDCPAPGDSQAPGGARSRRC